MSSFSAGKGKGKQGKRTAEIKNVEKGVKPDFLNTAIAGWKAALYGLG